MPIEIRRKDLKTLVDTGRAQSIDVLPSSEYKKQHLPHALNISLENLNAKTTQFLAKEDAIIVYSANCQCDRSARAACRLELMGFHEVYRYTPGKADWLAAGWPAEGTEGTTGGLRNLTRKNVPTCFLRERLCLPAT
jgi:rhodanese-related sulfurtransferase